MAGTSRKNLCSAPNCPLCRARRELFFRPVSEIDGAVLPPFVPLSGTATIEQLRAVTRAVCEQAVENARRSIAREARKRGSLPVDRGFVSVPRLTITWRNGRQRRRLDWVDAR